MTPGSAGRAGVLRHREPLARHTVWGIGGFADRYFEPAGIDELAAFLADLPAGEPVLWIGLGSNLLVRDGGVRGIVISTVRLRAVEPLGPTTIHAGAGAACPRVARIAARHGLTGCEFLAGIPGSMGGALAMNAGAFGCEIWPAIREVETLDVNGERRWRTASEFQYGYRNVDGPHGEWFVSCRLVLEPDTEGRAGTRIRQLLVQRAAMQPTGARTCGSVFRNPRGDYAGRLIEASGLKGHRIGGAVISRKHANFIINDAGACAADVEALIGKVVEEVEKRQGVRLEPEVRVVGEVSCEEATS
jgi:UDP-N-acetylmuramate dehydrogenase